MVEIEAIDAPETACITASEERLLDAAEVEALIEEEGLIKRSSVRMQLQSLAQKMRRDGNALKRVEASQQKVETAKNEGNDTSSKTEKSESVDVEAKEEKEKVDVSIPAQVAKPVKMALPVPSSSVKYKPIDRFSFDSGSYGSATVSVYITSLTGIGSIPKEQINCKFTSSSFDLTISNFNGKNYRLLKDNLDKEIEAEKSKCVVKANKIIIKLAKVKSEYGSYDSWTDLSSKKSKASKVSKSKDPSSSIMDLMKDMYDSGDDNMKKMIGETMMKQREGKLDKGGMAGMGGLDDLGDM